MCELGTFTFTLNCHLGKTRWQFNVNVNVPSVELGMILPWRIFAEVQQTDTTYRHKHTGGGVERGVERTRAYGVRFREPSH